MESCHFPKTAREWLKKELLKRQAKNTKYSARSFARALGISSGRLSELLAGKRRLTLRSGLNIAENLSLHGEERAVFLNLIQEEAEQKNKELSLVEKAHIQKRQEESRFRFLNEEELEQISGWEHFAILNIMRTNDFESDPKWIAQRLGLSLDVVKEAIARLLNIKLIWVENGRYQRSDRPLCTSNGIPSATIRKIHHERLKQAAKAIDNISVHERDFSSITIATSPKNLKLAKNLISNFGVELTDILEAGPKTEIYNLNIQFVPMSFRGSGYEKVESTRCLS